VVGVDVLFIDVNESGFDLFLFIVATLVGSGEFFFDASIAFLPVGGKGDGAEEGKEK